ncbi:MAG: hypothetical protein HRU09_09075 [Oligoflexales bacterium]|nr:hypothetical protein [Oligoflexales bacterium]
MAFKTNILIKSAVVLSGIMLSSCTLFQNQPQLEPPGLLQTNTKIGPQISCYSKPGRKIRKPQVQEVYNKAKASLLANGQQAKSIVWDQGELAKQKELKESLTQFLRGEKGASLKLVSLEGQSLEKIHEKLLKLGFRHTQVPLEAKSSAQSSPIYWLRNGSQISEIKDKRSLLPFHIYVHDDGSLVRLKPAGIPDPKRENPRPQPHGSKSVLLSHRKVCVQSKCELDTSFKNEGFKVAENGLPLPKAPSKNFGLSELPNRFQLREPMDRRAAEEAWKDAIMDFAHIDLQADFSHCH